MSAKPLQQKEEQLSKIDSAYLILQNEKQPMSFKAIVSQMSDLDDSSQEAYGEHIARLYTNMNLDRRFLSIGEDHWGLKNWYPFDQKKDEIEVPEPTHRDKRRSNSGEGALGDKELDDKELLEDEALEDKAYEEEYNENEYDEENVD